jgi:hypothetical protein
MNELLNDPHGLLEMEHESSSTSLPPTLISRFIEIYDFLTLEGRLPQETSNNLMERQLARWLESILRRQDLLTLIRSAGLESRLAKIQSLQTTPSKKDVHLVDPFGLLSKVKSTGIQQLRNISKVNRKSADSIAKRQKCEDFSQFEPKFDFLAQSLEKEQFKPLKSVAGKIKEGSFFVLNDLMGFVHKIDTVVSEQNFESGQRIREDGRTRVIFENGTESNLLLRSLEKALLSDGYLFIEREGPDEGNIESTSGFLYVVKSKREFAGVTGEMIKIGFTRTSLERRLAKAKTEAAYLFGEVEVVASYRCMGVDPAALESALHAFFAQVKLDIELNLGDNNVLKPKEWFGAKLEDIDTAISLALESELGNYVFDPVAGIVPLSK